MNLEFLGLSPERRQAAFEQVAVSRALNAVIVEKDFWVSWLLSLLFSADELRENVVFKGGTSLSKVYQAINRFSEDLDISLDPAFVGADETALEMAASRTKRDRAMHGLVEASTRVVRDRVWPQLEEAISKVLGRSLSGDQWLEFQFDDRARSPVLLFHYPAAFADGFSYLQRSVKLELGSITDQKPTGRYPISPWVAEAFPALFSTWDCEVVALEFERSFWEKATILHVEHYRAVGQPTPARYSRHYADLASLAQSSAGARAAADTAICARVVEWKKRYFATAWGRYDLARPGTFRLVPPDTRVAELKADYRAMRDMFLSDPPDFETVVEQLRKLEDLINTV